MVVDGSKLVRKLIADVLTRELPGVEVIGCDSIEDAQQALAQGPVDLVTTSLTLRDGDGLALARMVRDAVGQAYVPVIVVSGDAQQHLEQRRFTEYVTDYFDKALGHEALATFIRGYVQPQTIPGATILYIEDSRVVAEATKRMLERQQLNVLHVVSAEEAFTLLTAESLGRSRHRIDLVLTDVTLKAPPAGAGDDRRRQSPQPDRAAAVRRQRPGAQADRRTAAGYQGAVPAAAGPIERWTPDSMMDEVADTPTIQLEPSWKQHVGDYLLQPQMRELSSFLRQRKASGAAVFPPGPQLFAAFDATPFEQVKVVILGQDPYHGRGQAHGLSFSVPPGVPVPPSLLNIYKEIESDLGIPRPDHGCLIPWAQRGVLLLNAVLTVEEGKAGAHQGRGWEGFTDHVVDVLNREREGLVFMLWGAYAQQKGKVIDTRRHRVLKSPHPSPLSAHRGFLGCRHFSMANEYLQRRGQAPIDWSLPPRSAL
ncbi:hypothetical protein G6F65_010393 [Rhizopus arrhizus]|nr:hypothetical protein G6F65_010393 [Rhizopus arrhizus]